MGFEERLAIVIDSKADGAIAGVKSLGTTAEKTAAAEEKLAAAQSKAKLAGIAAEKSAISLAGAQRELAKVTASSTATDQQKQRAQLAVRAAEVKHGDAARAAAKAEAEATAAGAAHAKSLAAVESGAGRASGALKSGVALAAVSAGAAVTAFAVKSIGAASDLSESMSKAGVVFGKSAGEVLAFGDTAAKSIGQSKQQAIEAAGTFGNLFVSMGIGQKTSADLSISLVKLASDLASFNNTSPTEALEALRSGLTGETEPLRRYGVNLSAAAIQQEALRLGLAKTTAQVGPAATAQAAYSLILQQTKTAQGDFARTSGGLANQQRTASAQAADLAASTGKLLLPALIAGEKAANAFVGPLGKLADGIAGLPPEAKAAGVGLIGVATAAKAAQVVVPLLRDKVGGLVTGLKEIKPGALAAGAGLSVLTIAAGALIEHQKQGQQTANGYVQSLIDNSGITDTAGKIDFLRKVIQGNSGAQLQNNEQKFQAALILRDLATQLQSEGQAHAVVASQAATAAQKTTQLTGAAAAAAAATLTGVTYQNLFGEAVNTVTGKITGQKSEIDRLTGAIDKLNGKAINSVTAELDFKDALATLSEAAKTNGHSLSENTQKGRDNQRALVAAAGAARQLSLTVADTKGYDAGRAALIQSRAELERTAARYGLNKAQVDRLIASILRIPPARSTQLRTPGLDAAIAKFRTLSETIERVDGRAVSIRVGTGPLAAEARSKGGEVTGGTPGKDSVLSLLMPGERVLTVAQNRAYKLGLGRAGGLTASAGGGSVNIAAGAVVVNVGGTADRAVVPLIRREIDSALRDLAGEVATGRRA